MNSRSELTWGSIIGWLIVIGSIVAIFWLCLEGRGQ